jgi:hypothetical protein
MNGLSLIFVDVHDFADFVIVDDEIHRLAQYKL